MLAYANMVGGQDELVFDGDSIIVAADGSVLARGPQFEEALVLADLDLPAADPALPAGRQRASVSDGTTMTIERIELAPLTAPQPDEPLAAPMIWPRLSDLAEIYGALELGVRDYVRKNGFSSVIHRPVRRDRLGAGRHHRRRRARRRPGQRGAQCRVRYSSEHSVADAEDLARRQGIHARVVPIKPMMDGFESGLDLHGLAAENLQARIRGTIWMALSNEEGHLVLACGNKSELATGYSTLYGDSVGGFAPIKDVPKTLVWELARWRNEQAAERGRDAADPGELHRQAAERRTRAGPARHRLAARLRRYSTSCSTTTWRRTWARPSSSRPDTTRPSSSA